MVNGDTGCYVTERSWLLLSTQYAEQGPQRTCLRNMRSIHRRCTHTRQIRSGAVHTQNERWIIKRRMVQAMDDSAIEGTMVAACDCKLSYKV